MRPEYFCLARCGADVPHLRARLDALPPKHKEPLAMFLRPVVRRPPHSLVQKYLTATPPAFHNQSLMSWRAVRTFRLALNFLGRLSPVPRLIERLDRERGPRVALWDYAMRGIEAEAREAKPTLRSHKGDLDLQTIKNHQLSWWFDGEPLKAVLKDSATFGMGLWDH